MITAARVAPALLCAIECAAWAALVPETVEPGTFVWLNAGIFGMFVIGVLSAAGGMPTPSVAQVLHDVEEPAAAP